MDSNSECTSYVLAPQVDLLMTPGFGLLCDNRVLDWMIQHGFSLTFIDIYLSDLLYPAFSWDSRRLTIIVKIFSGQNHLFLCHRVAVEFWWLNRISKTRDIQRGFAIACLWVVTLEVLVGLLSKYCSGWGLVIQARARCLQFRPWKSWQTGRYCSAFWRSPGRGPSRLFHRAGATIEKVWALANVRQASLSGG